MIGSDNWDGIRGEKVSSRSPSREWTQGRRCLEEDCITVLSRYNPDNYCGVHGMTPKLKRRNMVPMRGGKHARAS